MPLAAHEFGGKNGGKEFGLGVKLLSDLQIKNAKARSTPYRMADSNGLSLAVSIAGGKSFRLKYRIDGKEKLLTLGKWPGLTLSRARELAAVARANKAAGRDPSTLKRQAAAVAVANADTTFESIALELHPKLTAVLAKRQHKTWLASMRREIFPTLGKLPITAITVPMLFAQLERIQKRGAIETGHRMRRRVEDVFSYAVRTGRADRNPAAELAKTLTKTNNSKKQPAAVDLASALNVFRTCNAYPASAEVQSVSQFIALTLARSDEVRSMFWTELEGLDTPEPYWLIPSEKRKGTQSQKADFERSFVIPLSPEAMTIIRSMRELNGDHKLVFPSAVTNRALSDMAISSMYKRAGFSGKHVPHGWRSSFSTVMNDLHPNLNRVIEAACAHFPKNTEGRYNRAKHLRNRRPLLLEWGKLLTSPA